jgi:single-stranded DNA-binding protein
MFNISFIYGVVASEPEPRFTVDQPDDDNVMFSLDISLQDQSFGWIKVYCRHRQAKLAAQKLHRGTRVMVVGNLIRGSLQAGEAVWWSEVVLVAKFLEIVE